MKREIKFRGANSEGWRYGSSLLQSGKFASILTEEDIACTPIDQLGPKSVLVSVDPETVGQYTGFKDAEGTEIYDGDIVFGAGEHFLVSWKDSIAQMSNGRDKDCIIMGIQQKTAWFSQIKVVGNRFDNPELLEDLK